MRRTLLATLTTAMMTGVLAISAPAQADAYFTTTPPEGCYLWVFAHDGYDYGAWTYCTRMHGLHRAVARCADGTVVHGFTEEMDYNLMSKAECRTSSYPWGPAPAVEVWGEYWPDY